MLWHVTALLLLAPRVTQAQVTCDRVKSRAKERLGGSRPRVRSPQASRVTWTRSRATESAVTCDRVCSHVRERERAGGSGVREARPECDAA
eukprot:1259176-Rhodomonas_salina.1